MAKSLCRLLIKVNHAIVANFNAANMSFNAICENKILAKISEFTVNYVDAKNKNSSVCLSYPWDKYHFQMNKRPNYAK